MVLSLRQTTISTNTAFCDGSFGGCCGNKAVAAIAAATFAAFIFVTPSAGVSGGAGLVIA